MKYIVISLFCLLLVACSERSTEPEVFDASIVCPENKRGTFVDDRDGQEYKYTTIGDQVWMAENLNYNAVGSICQGKDASKCELYGRLYQYTWQDRNTGRDTINWDLLDSVCPSGWHLPKLAEWEKLQISMGNDGKNAAYRLKSVNGWENSKWGEGIDACGFSVLPGGIFTYQSSHEGFSADFLSATAAYENMIYWYFFDEAMGAGYGPGYYTIRCLKD